jgi:hypothetical protein
MGFLDKAKKLAEQAQTKLDEVQGQFNEQSAPAPSGVVTEYDAHGRPVPPTSTAPPPPPATPGVPPTGSPAAPPVEAPPAAPPAPPAPGTPAPDLASPQASPPGRTLDRESAKRSPEDRNHPSYAPPTLTSGDPLAG